jgi:RNA polymerase sigma-70 factor (ECF subfamily)
MSAHPCITNLLPTNGAVGCEPAARAFSSTHASRRGPDALVFATIRRRAIDLARSSDRRSVREIEAGTPDADWFSPDVEERETQRLLEEAVKSLQPKYREVVTLKIWGGLTFQEIAEATGVPLNTAASRYRYALEGLRDILKGVVL